MNEFPIIGITGAARSGKDTIADYLCTEYGYGRVAFAAPLKRMVCALFNRDEAWLERNKDVPQEGMGTPRRLLQTLGTEWGRDLINIDIWVNFAREEIFKIRNNRQFDGVVITDLRFYNEAKFIRDLGGIIWRVDRAEYTPVETHISEQGIDPSYIERIIYNNSTLEELYTTVESYI